MVRVAPFFDSRCILHENFTLLQITQATPVCHVLRHFHGRYHQQISKKLQILGPAPTTYPLIKVSWRGRAKSKLCLVSA